MTTAMKFLSLYARNDKMCTATNNNKKRKKNDSLNVSESRGVHLNRKVGVIDHDLDQKEIDVF